MAKRMKSAAVTKCSDTQECKSICTDLEWELQEADKLIDYVRKRTDDNPFFVVASGALHGAPVTYDKQQVFVEKVMMENPTEFLDIDYAENAISGAQFSKTRAKALVDGTECYFKHCGKDGKKCKKPKSRDKFTDCLDKKAFGYGKKIIDLMREYMNDDEAVAVDRHVGNWMCKDAQIFCPVVYKDGIPIPFEFVKGQGIPEGVYDQIKDRLRLKARECGLTPAQLQVASWIKGACDAQGKESIYIGKGHLLNCQERRPKHVQAIEKFFGA